MKVKRRVTILFLIFTLLIAGCAKGGESTAPGGQNITDISTGESSISYRVEQLIPVRIEDPGTNYSNRSIYSAAYGSKLYLLVSYQFAEDEQTESDVSPELWMYVFDLNTLETDKNSFSPELPEEDFSVLAINVTGEDELALWLYRNTEGAEATLLCRTDLTGKLLNSEEPFSEDAGCLPNPTQSSDVFFAIPDADPLIAEWDAQSDSGRLLRCDTTQNTKVSLASLPGDFVSCLCAAGENSLYYVGNGELKSFDITAQSGQVLCNLLDCGIDFASRSHLLINTDGKLAFCSVGSIKTTVYLLTDEPEEASDPNTIRLVRLTSSGMDYVSPLAGNWSVDSGNYNIQTEKKSDPQDVSALWDTTLMELSSGKGPELMWVKEEDMRTLAEKGVLMDLSEIIPDDLKEELLPGVLQAGTYDGTLVGIAPEVSFYSMVTPNALWSGDSWTPEDVMKLIESGDDWEYPLSTDTRELGAATLFFSFFADNLVSSGYVDIENGISYFNGEEFIRLIEFCRKYGRPGGDGDFDQKSWSDIEQMMNEGKCAAQKLYLYSGLESFSGNMASYDKCHIVGYPTNNGGGNYVFGEGYLVVNANAVHTEAIQDFICYLLDYENQYKVYCSPVRKDVLRDRVVTAPNQFGGACVLKSYNGNMVTMLDTKPDGTTYLEEFMAFAESCEPRPYCPEAIRSILYEELAPFWNGDKSAEDTADIIHRRVQLYFDENK